MKTNCQPLAAAVLIALTPWVALAQTGTTAPKPAASSASAAVVPAAKPANKPQIMQKTPEDKRYRADAAVDDQNQQQFPVTPQVSIPLGKKVDPSKNYRVSPYGIPAPAGGINDSAAACLAKTDAAARAKCQAQLPKESTPR